MVYMNRRIFKQIENDYSILNASLKKGAVCLVYSKASGAIISIKDGIIHRYYPSTSNISELNECMLVINLNRKWQRDLVKLALLEQL